jgi:aminoglycoside phosphotransferase (APT) family kinase protein
MAGETDPMKNVPVAPETIPVRDDERLDEDRLSSFLRDELPGADQPLEVVQFAGGHANLTYLLRYGVQEYVLRRPPLGPVAASAHDMGREYRVLSVLYKAYPYAPRAFVYCEDAGIIGAPFFVMERRRGIVVRRAIPPQFGGGENPTTNRRISEVLIDALADLHDVDYASVGLANLGKPDGFMQRQVQGWTGRYQRAKTKELAVVDELSEWLFKSLPEPPAPTLLHNDWRLDNMMLDADDPGRVEAVFDWDMCTLGDPFADLGTLLATWVEENEAGAGVAVTMPSHTKGFLTRREAVQRYGERRKVDVSHMPYYYVFGLFKMAVVLQQIYHRYHVGQTQDARFASFEQVAEFLFQLAKSRADTPSL